MDEIAAKSFKFTKSNKIKVVTKNLGDEIIYKLKPFICKAKTVRDVS